MIHSPCDTPGLIVTFELEAQSGARFQTLSLQFGTASMAECRFILLVVWELVSVPKRLWEVIDNRRLPFPALRIPQFFVG